MKKATIKRIIEVVCSIAIFAYLIIHLTYVVRVDDDEKNCLMGFYAEPVQSLDIVMIGSSSLRSSIIPTRLYTDYGIKSYMIVTSVQKPAAIPYFLEEAHKYQPNALYVIDINNCHWSPDTWNKQNEGATRHITDTLKYSPTRIKAIFDEDIVSGDKKKMEYLFDIIKYHTNLTYFEKAFSWNYRKYSDSKGFKILEDVTRQEKYDNVEIDWDIARIDEIINYCQEKEISPLFVTSYTNLGISKESYEYLNEYFQKKGYSFLAFNLNNEKICVDYQNDFYDSGHLNANGSEKTTAFLENYLISHYVFENNNSNDTKWLESARLIDEEICLAQEKLEFISNNYLKITTNTTLEGNDITTSCLAESDYDIEYAWYIEKANDDGWERIQVIWYQSDNTYAFATNELNEGDYRIISFARVINNDEIKKSMSAASFSIDCNHNVINLEE